MYIPMHENLTKAMYDEKMKLEKNKLADRAHLFDQHKSEMEWVEVLNQRIDKVSERLLLALNCIEQIETEVFSQIIPSLVKKHVRITELSKRIEALENNSEQQYRWLRKDFDRIEKLEDTVKFWVNEVSCYKNMASKSDDRIEALERVDEMLPTKTRIDDLYNKIEKLEETKTVYLKIDVAKIE